MRIKKLKLIRKYKVLDFCCRLTAYGKKASKKYPFGSVGKSGVLRRLMK